MEATGASARRIYAPETSATEQRASAHPFSAWLNVGEERLFGVALGLFAVGCWLLVRHYGGVGGDARIYIGRALADLAPATIGRDVMFAHDGQSGFSLFTLVTRKLVAWFGVEAASRTLTLSGISLWFIAYAMLARRLAPGRLAWAMLIFAAVLPSNYGDWQVIVGEANAIPRPFAEAGVLFAFCALLDGRRVLAMGLLAAAATIHPLMAVCGFGVVLAVMALENPRWLALIAALVCLVILAALAGLPVFSRLFERVDSQWIGSLRHRNADLFPALWKGRSWARLVVQLSTVGIAASLLTGPRRRLFVATGVVGALGVAITFAMGDLYPSLLVLQIQPWRALWLVAVLSIAGAAICGVELWKRGGAGQLAMALLALAWLNMESPIAVAPALLAVGVRLLGARISAPASDHLAKFGWILLAVSAAVYFIQDLMVFNIGLRLWPSSYSRFDSALSGFDFKMVFLAPLVLWVVIAEVKVGKAFSWALAWSGLAFVAIAAAHWPHVAPYAVEKQTPDRELAAMLASRPGEVMWLNSDLQAWTLAGRASWWSQVQGASIVFSHPEAMAWQTRMESLLALRLVDKNVVKAFADGAAPDIASPSVASLNALCRLPQGPSWIISPLRQGDAAPSIAGVRIWRAPYVANLRNGGDTATWSPVDHYAVIPCDARRSST